MFLISTFTYLHSWFLLHERSAVDRNGDGDIGGGDLAEVGVILVSTGGRLGGQRPPVGLQSAVILLDVSSDLFVLLFPLQSLPGIELVSGPDTNNN